MFAHSKNLGWRRLASLNIPIESTFFKTKQKSPKKEVPRPSKTPHNASKWFKMDPRRASTGSQKAAKGYSESARLHSPMAGIAPLAAPAAYGPPSERVSVARKPQDRHFWGKVFFLNPELGSSTYFGVRQSKPTIDARGTFHTYFSRLCLFPAKSLRTSFSIVGRSQLIVCRHFHTQPHLQVL